MNQERPCKWCETLFTPTQKHKNTQFCSKACANRHTAANRSTTRGWVKNAKGYVLVRAPQHPMADAGGYVMQHRMVMAEHLGRSLDRKEVVHHKNGVKDDNRLENLELMSPARHNQMPKPPVRPIACPHCGGMIEVSGRVRRVAALT